MTPLAIALGLAAASPAAAAGVYTLDEIACNAKQLDAFLQMSRARSLRGNRTTQVTVSYGDAGGTLAILAVLGLNHDEDAPSPPETYLWLTGNPFEPTLQRDPARPQLPSFSLGRNELLSDLASGNRSAAVELTFDPSSVIAGTPAIPPIRIDSRAGGAGAATRAGGALGPVLVNCSDKTDHKLDAVSIHILRVLSSILRPWVLDGPATPSTVHFLDTEMSIYRGEDTNEFQVDIWGIRPNGQRTGRMSVHVNVEHDGSGVLGIIDMRILPACTSAGQMRCTTLTSGAGLRAAAPGARNRLPGGGAYTVYQGGTGASSNLHNSFDAEVVLDHTTWIAPLGVPGS